MFKNMKQSAFTNARNSLYINDLGWQIFFRTYSPRIMLTLLATFLLLISITASAQTFTPVEYNFQDQPSFNDNGFKERLDQNPATLNLRFIHTASNGYGTWAVNGDGYWFLMSNDLQNETPQTGKEAIPSGVVDYGKLISTGLGGGAGFGINADQTKVAVNLDGKVRFVSVRRTTLSSIPTDNNAVQFVVQGFDEEDFDISFAGIPKAANSRKVVKNSIRLYNTDVSCMATYLNSTLPCTIVGDVDWRDMFDIAMDKNFLYIVWQSDGTIFGLSRCIKKILATVINLSTGAEVTGWPKVLTLDGKFGGRPTVACNIYNASLTPSFDVAYVTYTPPYQHECVPPVSQGNYVRAAQWISIVNGTFNDNNSIKTLPGNFRRTGINNQNDGVSFDVGHARMLVEPRDNAGSQIPVKGIYVTSVCLETIDGPAAQPVPDLAEREYCDRLIFYRIENNQPPTFGVEVDGVNFVTRAKSLIDGRPYSDGEQTLPYFIMNRHLLGVANPYDGKNTDDYDEFHCIYSVTRVFHTAPTTYSERKPLYIVRGRNNGQFLVNGQSLPDSRTIISRKKIDNNNWNWVDDPQINEGIVNHLNDNLHTYGYLPAVCASVNQMGINVYWIGEGSEITPWGHKEKVWYTRDIRAFDEDIKENTLVTHTCFVKDGTSHGGTLGATLLDGKRMTLWTDLDFDISEGKNGVYVPLYNNIFSSLHSAKLHFVGENASLKIGQDLASDATGATLTALPNNEIIFGFDPSSGNADLDNNNQLIIQRKSTFDWYGIPSTFNSVELNNHKKGISGIGEIRLKGQSADMTGGAHGYPTDFTRPATLLLHGGSIMRVGDGVKFSAEHSIIESKYQASIEPPYGTTQNPHRQGRLDLHGKAVINECKIIGGNTSTDAAMDNIITIRPPQFGEHNYSEPQFTLTNSYVVNSSAGRGKISALSFPSVNSADRNVNFGNILIDGGRYDNVMLYATSPVNAFDIQFGKFYGLKDAAIHFVRNNELAYDKIQILGNQFFSTSKSNSSWIKFEEFTMHHVITTEVNNPPLPISYVQTNRITILGNLWESAVGSTNNQPHTNITAIHLINSAAAVANNTITAQGYRYGIYNEMSSTFQPLFRRSTFICSNTINGCNENENSACIRTENWFGYSKLNLTANSNVGHLSGVKDNGGLVFTSFFAHRGPGLKLQGVSSELKSIVDIRGVIPTFPQASDPYAAYNNFYANNNIFGTPGSSGEIEVNEYSSMLIGKWDASTSNEFGKNNITRLGTESNFIYGNSTSDIDVGSIDQNYWRNFDDLSTYFVPEISTQQPPFENIIYTIDSEIDLAENPFSYGNVYCSSGIPATTKTGGKNTTLSINSSDTTCKFRAGLAYETFRSGQCQKAFEMYQYYFELCAQENNSYDQFDGIGSANSCRSEEHSRHSEFREWLKKVLYYNLDKQYYCSDATAMLGTFSWFNDERGKDAKGSISVVKYLMESGKCYQDSAAKSFMEESIQESWDFYYRRWQDSVRDTLATPFDSTLPTLEDLDLTILYGPPGSVTPVAEMRIGTLTASPNPFGENLELRYELIKSAMVRIDVFDILGKTIYESPQGFKEKGEHQHTIPNQWPSGTYYIRLSTLGGEVKTVKVIRE